MDAFEAVLLGLIQGLTEFLPVSSSGHLVMTQLLLGIHAEGILFEIAVHAGTLIAVLVFYRRRVAELVRGALGGGGDALRYVGKLALATTPAAVAALVARDFFESLFDSPWVVGVALIATGLMLWTTRATVRRAVATEPSWVEALAIGCAQLLAIVPGISRSGATVAAALALGVAPLAAAEFSFLMSVVAIGGAAVLSLPDAGSATEEMRSLLLLGSAVAAVSGVAALWLFVRLLRSGRFHHFAYYAWVAGAGFLIWQILTT